jgi:hypothetical protein
MAEKVRVGDRVRHDFGSSCRGGIRPTPKLADRDSHSAQHRHSVIRRSMFGQSDEVDVAC